MTTNKLPNQILTRSDGERERAKHIVSRLRGCLEAIEIGLKDPLPIGNEAGEAVTKTAIELAVVLAKLDAYSRMEADQMSNVCNLNLPT